MGKVKLQIQVNPPWVKSSMTVQQAANQASLRGFFLKASWSGQMGLRIVAIPKEDR